MNCESCQNALPDLLLDPGSAAARAAEPHLRDCPACLDELTQLRSTMHLLDAWQAPEPSPWFDTRIAARLRQAQAAPPESALGAAPRHGAVQHRPSPPASTRRSPGIGASPGRRHRRRTLRGLSQDTAAGLLHRARPADNGPQRSGAADDGSVAQRRRLTGRQRFFRLAGQLTRLRSQNCRAGSGGKGTLKQTAALETLMPSLRPNRHFAPAAVFFAAAAFLCLPPAFAQGHSPNRGRAAAEGPPARMGAHHGQHLAQWMDSHKSLPLAQQQQALEREPGFHDLAPEVQQRMLNRPHAVERNAARPAAAHHRPHRSARAARPGAAPAGSFGHVELVQPAS